MKKNTYSKTRFTLTELAVILGILVVFILLLIPGLKKRRRGYPAISCTNNLKQIGLSMRMYSNVYDEAFPEKNGRTGLEMPAVPY